MMDVSGSVVISRIDVPRTSSMDWNTTDMFVTKRNGSKEAISFDKILQRLKKLGREISPQPSLSNKAPLNYTSLAMKVIDQLYDGIPTTEIDTLSADLCASLSSIHPHYSALAGRIVVSNHHKDTYPSFMKTMRKLYNNVDVVGKSCPLLSKKFYQTVQAHSKELDAMCDYNRDYLLDFFGVKTLLKSYLMKIQKMYWNVHNICGYVLQLHYMEMI